jgi:hypothetical protein
MAKQKKAKKTRLQPDGTHVVAFTAKNKPKTPGGKKGVTKGKTKK